MGGASMTKMTEHKKITKKLLKRGICTALAVSMVFGLCACGKSDSTATKTKNKTDAQNSELAKQYVYSYNEFDIPIVQDDGTISAFKVIDNQIYVLTDKYIYNDDYSESSEEYNLIEVSEDGSMKSSITIQLPDDNEDTTSYIDDENAYEYTSYGYWTITDDMSMYAIRNYYKSYTDENGDYASTRDYDMCIWNMDGELENRISLKDMLAQDGWISSMTLMPDNSLLIMFYDENGDLQKMTMSSDGSFSTPVSVSTADVWGQMYSMINKDDGSAYIIYQNPDDNWNMYVTTYDFATDTMGEATKLPDRVSYGFNSVGAGIDTDLVFSMSDGLYTYNIGDEDATQIMSCINSDLSAYSLYNFEMIDSDHFIAFYYEYSNYAAKGAYFTKVNPEDVPDKSVVVLGGNYIGSELKSKVIDFNKNNSEYRIVVTDYSTYNTNEDYTAALTKLNNDIISGNMPDILEIDDDTPIENYISKGLIADIDSLIAEDDELKGKEFLQNVFDAYRVDGKLYRVIPYFYVRTFAGKTSLLGDRTSWTMDDLTEIMASLPEDTQTFGEYTRSSFIWDMMSFCGNDFVDVATGKCNFDSDNFIKMLEYAATLPEELSDDYYSDDYWYNYDSQYRENRTLLMRVYLNSMSNMSYNINGYFGEDISLVGFPNESGQGGIIVSYDSYAISAKSSNIDGAWQFVRQYLLDDYQDNIVENNSGIPVSMSAFDKWVQKGMEKPYYMDENGEKQEYDQSFYINDEEIKVPVLTQEQTDYIKNYILSVDKAYYYNNDVMNIVTEEAEAYFSGQKSAEDVAAVIQSRVQIYVNENR
jgi:ABC-type glycerol-3-phosphate transport system substrate-binding protein